MLQMSKNIIIRKWKMDYHYKNQSVSSAYKICLCFQHPDSFSMIFFTKLIFAQPGYYFLNRWIDSVGMIFPKVCATELSNIQITLSILLHSLLWNIHYLLSILHFSKRDVRKETAVWIFFVVKSQTQCSNRNYSGESKCRL